MGHDPAFFHRTDPRDTSDSDSESQSDSKEPSSRVDDRDPTADLILEELGRILESIYFHSSKRSSQFLDFIVRYQLENPSEPLKERAIGTGLYGRPADYATGDDSVVRVQAREVRRKLEKYYQAFPDGSPIRIDLPLGSYVPDFSWVKTPATSQSALIPVQREEQAASPSLLTEKQRGQPRRRKYLLFGSALAVLCLVAATVAGRMYLNSQPDSVIRKFWSPAYASNKALLICLAKPVLYRPSAQLYQRHEKWPGEFSHIVNRMDAAPNLKPNAVIHWGDMERYYDFGVAQGDVEAAVSISDFLVRHNKSNEVRIGNGYTLEDIRSSPSVIIGAFSNPLAMQLIAGLHFSFVENNTGIHIQEAGPHGRTWSPRDGPTGQDYGLITRLVNSNTGQFTLLVAGLNAGGSSAAAELITNPQKLAQALRHAPKDWLHKNVQIVVGTSVTNFVNSPPKIVAVYVW